MPQSIFGDHQVLRHVDQAPGQVAGIRGLQRRIGQTLAGAVGGDEVLQNVQALAEVRRDRGLDDRAVGLGHQAAHAGELADLGRAAAGAGVGHHEDRIEGLLPLLDALEVGRLLGAELLHHRLGDLIIRARPDVHDLVVALAVRDQTRGVLILDLLHFTVGRGHELGLLLRNDDVVDAEGDARTGRVGEAGVHELVGEDHRLLQTQRTVAGVDGSGDRLLGHVLVDEIEGQALGQDLGQQRPADRGLHMAHALLHDHLVGVQHMLTQPHAHARLQVTCGSRRRDALRARRRRPCSRPWRRRARASCSTGPAPRPVRAR